MKTTRRAFLHSAAVVAGFGGVPAARTQTSRPARRQRDTSIRTAALTLTADGFDPPAVEMAQGRTLLVTYNRSGVSEVGLQIERRIGGPSSQSFQQVRRELLPPRKSARWTNVLNLQPGVLRVSVVGQPQWACILTVS